MDTEVATLMDRKDILDIQRTHPTILLHMDTIRSPFPINLCCHVLMVISKIAFFSCTLNNYTYIKDCTIMGIYTSYQLTVAFRN